MSKLDKKKGNYPIYWAKVDFIDKNYFDTKSGTHLTNMEFVFTTVFGDITCRISFFY